MVAVVFLFIELWLCHSRQRSEQYWTLNEANKNTHFTIVCLIDEQEGNKRTPHLHFDDRRSLYVVMRYQIRETSPVVEVT